MLAEVSSTAVGGWKVAVVAVLLSMARPRVRCKPFFVRQVVAMLLAVNASLIQCDSFFQQPALSFATLFEQAQCMSMLLQARADVSQPIITDVVVAADVTSPSASNLFRLGAAAGVGRVGESCLMRAAARGNIQLCTLLIEASVLADEPSLEVGADDIYSRVAPGPLLLAAEAGHLEVVKLLLDKKATVDRVTICDSSLPAIVQEATGRAVGSIYHTPLSMALSRGHLLVAEHLLHRRADPSQEAIGEVGFPVPLIVWCCAQGYTDACKLLLLADPSGVTSKTDHGAAYPLSRKSAADVAKAPPPHTHTHTHPHTQAHRH